MPTIDERLASLEARMDRMDDLHNAIAALRGDMNRQFDLVNGQFSELRADMNRRFEQVDRRFEQMDRRFEQVENRFHALDGKVDRHFTWLVGIQMALMVAVIGAMVGAYYR